MEEKMTMEITNDRLEEAIKEYAADRTKERLTTVLICSASDKAVCTGDVAGTGSPDSMFFKE